MLLYMFIFPVFRVRKVPQGRVVLRVRLDLQDAPEHWVHPAQQERRATRVLMESQAPQVHLVQPVSGYAIKLISLTH